MPETKTATKYAIRFDLPEGVTVYAGLVEGALGWAPTLANALLSNDRETAGRYLSNGYGAMTQYGYTVAVEIGDGKRVEQEDEEQS